MSRATGGVIAAVRPGSIGAEVGLEPGDVLLSINGHPLRDVIDYRYYGAEERLRLVVQRGDERHRLEIERDYDEELGLEFVEPLFDGLRRCNNRCPFCFVRQMPQGLRPSLYLHDDDYRYSFLLGNFITLTNLTERDWRRIGEQRLSPLYVSIHATDPEVRRRVLGNPCAPDVMAQLRRLGEMGIAVHGQIVIWPGVNDGAVLARSIEELLALWPTLRTLALVPVGLTRYHDARVRLLRADEAATVLALADEYAPQAHQRTGRTWLYPSDELYLLAGRSLPAARFYDDDAQRENGVGLVRALLDDWRAARRRAQPAPQGVARITLACGTLIASILDELAAELAMRTGIEAQVVPVVNRLFGESVTVSGLLCGADVLAALAGRELGQVVFLPRAMFDAAGRLTLDDMTPAELSARLGVRTVAASTLGEVLAFLAGATTVAHVGAA